MRIAVVDDEKSYIDSISEICRKFGADNVLELTVSGFSDGESFLRSLDGGDHSVVFMDVYMGGMSGTDAARRLRERDQSCILIFLTSSGEHMPEAFSCHAFEYIQKPFTERRVADVLADALKILPSQNKYIDVYSDRRTVRLPLDEIVCAITDAHYLNIETTDGRTLRCRMTASQFAEQTNDPRFISVNKGITVNADHIVDFDNNCCIADNGARIPIKVRDRVKIEQSLRDYHFDKIRSCQPGSGDGRLPGRRHGGK
ncbi:MAG: LytTR family DNA-binding domain-containing protein [Bacteroides sp.]|nr:LytTR family DNA-binding domain-containing protein [Eubacterium sp.]MCM1417372.1 LytTR family DNA-binding domain-containing protein [Roseburia sp.]MCM1461436.1 LytTR family DNA-binding domain-containing protein [Bacteroides sp.]